MTTGSVCLVNVMDMRRRRTDLPSPDLLDIALAVGSFGLFTLPVLIRGSGHSPAAAVVVFGAAVAVPLVVRRAAPVPVLITVSSVLVVAALTDVGFTVFHSNAGPALAIAVLTVADRLPRAVSLRVGVAAVGLVTAAELIAMQLHPATGQNAIQLVLAIPAWLVGYAFGSRRQAERRLRMEEEERAREAERRVRAEERVRVSADVHDIVSHTLSMIAVRSGVARMVLEQRPGEALVALAAIETASRSALDELRAVLQSLRDAPEDLVRTGGPLAAGPTVDRRTLAHIRSLVDDLREDGHPITLSLTTDAGAPPAVEESAYRVVQEALTNVVRHAGRATTSVEVERGPEGLDVTVVNDVPVAGTFKAGRGSGNGLAGMRDRVSLYDGTVEAGPRRNGGYAVRVHFPLPPATRPEPGDRTGRRRRG
ncbi:sensor histidine kinase [Micromonospora arida]|uniref:histidine kinase n=1 Tax=Micromonospora arida TaxID=2203715 RepID=A0A3N9X5J3_9ACTN|nr:histidine kinase [Micromonospora arida]RQX08291.1 histidine kinase [Micromonospora arida]